ncbi:metallopeptidase family protein [Phenylobacterium sp.]|uniref:metallopeptidase family protein n=1 Tax=Phenylobacterium sp. TaxID=1871053 RepID=UPI0035B14456
MSKPYAGTSPSLDDLAALAEAAFAALPEDFRRLTGDVVFRVDDFASDEVLDELGIEDPFELTGLYSGVHIGHRSVLDPSPGPSRIFLYRRAILDEWAARGDISLADLVGHVLVHEIGHHFGLSDDDIHAIEDAAE